MEDDYQMFKIVVIGSMGTGKTNLSTRFMKGEYNQSQKSTIGVQFLSKIVNVKNQTVKVTLWDTAGQERYKSLSKVYYRGASGILIVYDITDPQSYLDVESWMRLVNENVNLNQVVLMVVGNKVDLQSQRRVPSDRPIKQYKQKFDIDCWQASAKSAYNVKQVFLELIDKIYEKNLQMRSSAFQDASEIGSVGDPSFIRTSQPKNNSMKKVKNQTIHEVIIQQNEAQQKIPARKDVKPKAKQNVRITGKNNKPPKKSGCC